MKYQVQITGENFLVDFDGRIQKMGFITFRCTEAENPARAENVAIDTVRQDPRLRQIVLNTLEDPPVMAVTELHELSLSEDSSGLPENFIWYSEDET